MGATRRCEKREASWGETRPRKLKPCFASQDVSVSSIGPSFRAGCESGVWARTEHHFQGTLSRLPTRTRPVVAEAGEAAASAGEQEATEFPDTGGDRQNHRQA